MSKVSKDCFGFASLYPVIGQKLKTIVTWSPAFSRALCNLVVFTMSSHSSSENVFLRFMQFSYFYSEFSLTFQTTLVWVLQHPIEMRSIV